MKVYLINVMSRGTHFVTELQHLHVSEDAHSRGSISFFHDGLSSPGLKKLILHYVSM
jgi:hypothetical protein